MDTITIQGLVIETDDIKSLTLVEQEKTIKGSRVKVVRTKWGYKATMEDETFIQKSGLITFHCGITVKIPFIDLIRAFEQLDLPLELIL